LSRLFVAAFARQYVKIIVRDLIIHR
jgi:hypothetical protein